MHYAGVPRLTEQYVRTRGGVTNDIPAKSSGEIGAYVFDKNYFDAQAIKNAPNLDPRRPEPVRFDAG